MASKKYVSKWTAPKGAELGERHSIEKMRQK